MDVSSAQWLSASASLITSSQVARNTSEEKNSVFSDPAYLALKARIRASDLPLREKKALLRRAVQIFENITDPKKRAAAVTQLLSLIALKEKETEEKRADDREEFDRFAEQQEIAASARLAAR